VQFYPGKHPCEKPADMLKQIISASSRPGDIVADFFMGSGSTVKAAIELGRRAIGVELEEDRFIQTTEEVEKLK
uniref:site-specific DNA-methyltransferase n=2 Tax=Citrobacter TaxID=544 RepID=UPI001FFE282C